MKDKIFVGIMLLAFTTAIVPVDVFAKNDNRGKEKKEQRQERKIEQLEHKIEKIKGKQEKQTENLKKKLEEVKEKKEDREERKNDDCTKKAYGHLIAPGWIKNNGSTTNPCPTLPPGIGKKVPRASTTPDTVAPIISEIQVVRTTSRSAVIEWKTNEPASSKIIYGTTTAYGLKKTEDDRERTHRMKIKKLIPNTTYNFAVVATDRAGNTSTSSNMTFATKQRVKDTTAPAISGVTVSVGTSTARITWTTSEPTTSEIDYGTTTSYGSNTTALTLGTSHDITLTSLTPVTTYNFRITAEDSAGNATSTNNLTFTTNALPVIDTTAPAISGITVTSVGSTTATVSWTTNEIATGKLYYGTTSPLSLGSALSISSGVLSLNHTFAPIGLTASTTYYFVLESKDGSNNATTTAEMSFTTGL